MHLVVQGYCDNDCGSYTLEWELRECGCSRATAFLCAVPSLWGQYASHQRLSQHFLFRIGEDPFRFQTYNQCFFISIFLNVNFDLRIQETSHLEENFTFRPSQWSGKKFTFRKRNLSSWMWDFTYRMWKKHTGNDVFWSNGKVKGTFFLGTDFFFGDGKKVLGLRKKSHVVEMSVIGGSHSLCRWTPDLLEKW